MSELVTAFSNKGGRINRFYLLEPNKNKHAIVYLDGWFAGKNIREALIKALFPEK